MSNLAVLLNLVRIMERFENLMKATNVSPGKSSASQNGISEGAEGFRGFLVLRPGDLSSTWRLVFLEVGLGSQASAVVGVYLLRNSYDMYTHLGVIRKLRVLCF